MDILRLLFIRLSALGDVVHALPAAFNIKKRFPDTRLTWIVEPPQLELLENNPLVDEVIVMPKSAWVSGIFNAEKCPSILREMNEFVSDLVERRFDVAIDLQGLMKSALIGYISGAPIRIGYGGTKEKADLLYTHRLPVSDFRAPDKHVVDLHMELSEYLLRIFGKSDVESSAEVKFILPPPSSETISKVGMMVSAQKNLVSSIGDDADGGAGKNAGKSLLEGSRAVLPVSGSETEDSKVTDKDMVASGQSNFAVGSNIGSKKELVLIPGTTWETKIWPYENWADLSQMLVTKYDSRIILVGGPSDIETNRNIKNSIESLCPQARVNDLTGRTVISDLVELFNQVGMVIGLDTGPLHLAAAVGACPVLAIHGSTPWGRNGPYGEQCHTVHLDLECQPCFKRICPIETKECLTELTARHVFDRIVALTDS